MRDSLNRRTFLQVSAASLMLGKLLSGESLLASRRPLSMREFVGKNNPFGPELQKLWAMLGTKVQGWKVHADDLPHPESPSLNDSGWPLYQSPSRTELSQQPADSGGMWFRKWITIPRTMGGYDIEGLPVKLNVTVLSRSNRNVRVFSNGSLVEMTSYKTQQPILLMDRAKPGTKFLIAVYSPVSGSILGRLEVEYPVEDSNPQKMLEEILCVQEVSNAFPDGRAERHSQLRAAVNAIDFGALERGNQTAFNKSLAAADSKMQLLAKWVKQFTINAVGNSHIDLAWKWSWTEAVEVVRDTFGTVLELMDQYPQITFAQSSAQDFLWLENKYPDLFKAIQKRVKDGHWEMVGGMWCEPDLNIPCGESLVRQLLTGKVYFQKKFGVDVKIGWNPDSFGYSRQLPQIYKRSGIDYFVTQKMSWNDTTQLPYKLFHWEAPDGSRILTFFPHGYGNGINPVQEAEYIAEDTRKCSGFRRQMLLYGVGDHGGGPTRQMLDAAVRWHKSPKAAFPNFQFSTAHEFFREVDNNLSRLNLPVWNNELYLQFHRGTYTTQAETKKRMRKMEVLMLNSEKFCSLAMLKGRKYPQPEFEDCWHRVLFCQFHDLMAGSGIHVIYEEAAESMEFVKLTGDANLESSMETLAQQINTRGPGRPVVVFNPLSWERTDVTEAQVQFPGAVEKIEVRDPEGHVMPSTILSRDDSTNTVRVLFLARSVPSTGYRVFYVVSVHSPRQAAITLKTRGLHIENEFFQVEIDHKTGCVTKLVNKRDGKNILRPGSNGNLLEAFVNNPRQYDAWNIDPNYEKYKTELLDAEEVKVVENSPVRVMVRVKKKYQDSSFIQDICMYPEIPRVDVHMQADWHEKHIMLKVAFPLDIKPLMATYEIPYGTIERPAIPHVLGKAPVPFTEAKGIGKRLQTYNPLLAQEAEFEVCAQQWGDLSENGRGFSLLNDCKYGYDTFEPGTIRLTLLRSTTFPDPHADQGLHKFTYSMHPHIGGWREGETELRGFELNYPLLPLVTVEHEGSLPSAHSFAQIEPKNVILTAIKKAEADDALIFRFFEYEGKPSKVRLRLPQVANRAVETNLMEKEEQALSLDSNGTEVVTPIGRYEIKSIKVNFSDAAGSAPGMRV